PMILDSTVLLPLEGSCVESIDPPMSVNCGCDTSGMPAVQPRTQLEARGALASITPKVEGPAIGNCPDGAVPDNSENDGCRSSTPPEVVTARRIGSSSA